MSQPYVGEMHMFGGNFAPVGWPFCNGSLLPISENPALFQLIGTTYGGDGQTTFALPNLQSRIPIHVGSGFTLGQNGGQETVTLTTSQLPAHNHLVRTATASQGGAKSTPGGSVIADENLPSGITPPPLTYTPYANDANQRTLGSTSIQNTGGSQPHDNMVPFLAVSFIISLFGVFPSQT